ncbi:DUF4188 domain-containing protein [Williamsia muralis]|uniref:DUF4188 domain-containing protein n=1 Tax=Williamsia marianensis TaxID=85044 RepID=A0A2G3PGJ4_WILMA|nr:DUF4188 domain-containing protein [Williamsia marianensis]PHV64853.1 hypothetical protein CSW57_21510 [Williamsia marianensis]
MTVMKTTHDRTSGDNVVVFLLGMRLNKVWRVDAWLPVFVGQYRMLKELSRDPDSGLLGYRTVFGKDGGTSIQYWRDTESLYAYAADMAQLHRPAQKAFFRRERNAVAAVGIWHETYEVAASETIYGDMPPIGLAKALGQVPITKDTMRARQRLGSQEFNR